MIELKVDDRAYRRAVARFLKELPRVNGDFLKHQAGLTARDLSAYTPPYTGTNSRVGGYGDAPDRKVGEVAVLRDIRRAVKPIAPPNKWRNKGIQKLIRQKNAAALEPILRRSTSRYQNHRIVGDFTPRLHKGIRDSRGRVTRDQRVLAFGAPDIKRYRSLKKKDVGRAKASWAALAVKLSVKRKPPSWVSRHFGGLRSTFTKFDDSITLRSSENGASHVNHRMSFIKKQREAAMLKQFERTLKDNIRKTKME